MISESIERALNTAAFIAEEHQHEMITLEHVILALLDDPEIDELLKDNLADTYKIENELKNYIKSDLTKMIGKSKVPPIQSQVLQRVIERCIMQGLSSGMEEVSAADLLASILQEQESKGVAILRSQKISRLKVLESLAPTPKIEESESKYLTNMIHQAELGKLDPLIGRKKELTRIKNILMRRNKNNPLLVGDEGVGKTSIINGLAFDLLNKNMPLKLADCKIFSVNLGSLIAGTKYRGDLEQRVEDIFKSIENIKSPILFFDEIHTIVGAGQTSGSSIDLSSLIKPLMTDGRIKFIGCTTFSELKLIEQNRALFRRFNVVEVAEPTKEEVFEIIAHSKITLETFHGVKFESESINRAIELANHHLADKKSPDKILDVLDEAGAISATRKESKVTIKTICEVISSLAKVPVADELKDNSLKARLIQLKTNLYQKVFGQDVALESIYRAVLKTTSGLSQNNRPIGSFLFAGPTGVGKTEVAKAVAQALEIPLIRFDMSEFSEKHTVSRLIGAPPGYVGFDQGGLLVDAIRRSPYSLLLLDEIEKAHEDLYNLLLQVMEEGQLTDNNGRKADFKNVIIIMTSNVGSDKDSLNKVGFFRESSIDSNNGKGRIGIGEYERHFRPEFRNRLDLMVRFETLDRSSIIKVVEKFILELAETLSAKKIKLSFENDLVEFIADKGYEIKFGARSIRRYIDNNLKDKIAEWLVFEHKNETILILEIENGEIRLKS